VSLKLSVGVRSGGRYLKMLTKKCAPSKDRPEFLSIRTALVYDGHLSPVVAADGYFDAIVPFSELLKSKA